MTFITIISSLINLAGISSWTQHPIMSLFLTIDGLIYTLVSYSFKLFMLMCQINYDSLSGILATLMDNLKALVMVFVVFKVGIQLIQFLLNPEDAPKGGKEFLKNIFIASALLILYPFVMGVINEVGILIMGNDINYSFPILSRVAGVEGGNDEGLIMRFIFGDGAKDVEDIGDYLAYQTVTIFVHDINEGSGNREVKAIICKNGDGTCNFHDLPNIVPKLDKTIEYQWGISALVGGFLVYSIVRNAIELGVRMFKLVILQMLAPLAIISIVKDGPKGKIFSNFVSTYLKTFADAFVRMLTMLLITVFVCKFFMSIEDFFGSNVTADMPRITRLLLTILIIVAAYRFAGQVPQFLQSILGVNLGEGGIAGFGRVVGGVVGTGAGVIGGVATGIAGGAGVLGTVGNAVAGGFNGAQNGARANSVADFFRGQGDTTAASRQRARTIAAAGGLGGYVGHGVENRLGITAAQEARAQREQDRLTRLENYDNAVGAAMGKDDAGNEFGTDRTAYINARADEFVAESEYGSDREAYVRAQEDKAYQERLQELQTDSTWARTIRNNEMARNKVNSDYQAGAITEAAARAELQRLATSDASARRGIETAANSVRATARTEATERYNTETAELRSNAERAAGHVYDEARVNAQSNRDVLTARRSLEGRSTTRAQRRQVDAGQSHEAVAAQRQEVNRRQHAGALERRDRQNLGS